MNIIKISFDRAPDLHIQLYQNSFVSKWVSLLQEELQTKEILQLDTFSFFIDEQEARQHLLEAIDAVNKFLKTIFIDVPTDSDFKNPDYYNYLHLQFEKLAGPDWNKPTRLVLIAPPAIKLAIRHINRFCHRLEHQSYKIKPMLRVEFDSSRREPLAEEDYKLFEQGKKNNQVYLDYSTLGKSLYECYEDGLPPTYAGLKMQEHYCANFVLSFGKTPKLKSPNGFKSWLIEHGIDSSTIKNLGHIPLGYIVEKEMLQFIVKCRKINKITLE
jgi:hypothetical protein